MGLKKLVEDLKVLILQNILHALSWYFMAGSFATFSFYFKSATDSFVYGKFFFCFYIYKVSLYIKSYIYAWEPPYTVVGREDVEQLELGNI